MRVLLILRICAERFLYVRLIEISSEFFSSKAFRNDGA